VLQPREVATTCPECKKRDARITRLERELAETKDALVGATDRIDEITKELDRLADMKVASRIGFAAMVASGKKEIREALKGSLPPFDTLPLNGLYCAECLESQRVTIGGACCKNHHGGVDGLPPETPRVLGPLTVTKELIVRDDEAPEKILELARAGKIPRGWILAVGKGPCIVCLEPTSGRHGDSWRHYECSADVKVDPNYGTLGHNRPSKKPKVEAPTGFATTNGQGKPDPSGGYLMSVPPPVTSRTDDAAEF
jgi:hypothetical protein